MSAVPTSNRAEFGSFLRTLRRRLGMNQRDLAAAVGFSEAQISRLETGQRLPVVVVVAQTFVPALGLGEEPRLAVQLVELAAAARGEKPPSGITVQRHVRQMLMTDEVEEQRLLPTPPTSLLGRERDVDQLVKRILGHTGRLITLVGPPGIGKSRLALEVIRRLAAVYRDGAAFIPLTAVDDPHLVGAAIAGELGLADSNRKSSRSRLIEHLRRKELVLALDNFEQVIDAAPLVADLLTACPGLRVIATSRERLHLRAEQRFVVQPLDLTRAVELFVHSARAVDPDFQLTADNRPLLETICIRLDCLPLAIELSAVWVELLPLGTLLARLKDSSLDLLGDAARDRPPHHKTLRAAIWRSYSLLNSAEQALFRAVSVFIGGFDVAAVEALGFNAGVLQSLLGKSLIQRGGSAQEGRRFLQLDTLRDFAMERLAECGDEEETRHRHGDYYLALACRGQPASGGVDKLRWLDRVESEIYNIRGALRFLIDRDRVEALQMAAALHDFWYIRGYNAEGRRWLAEAMAGQDEQNLDYAGAQLAAGQLAMAQSEYREAKELTARSLTRFRMVDDRRQIARALHQLGWIARETEAHEESYGHFAESLQILRALDERAFMVQVLSSLAALLGASGGNVEERRAYQNDCLVLARESGDNEALAYVLGRHGTLEMLDGQTMSATSMLCEAANLFQTMGFKREEAWAREELAEAHCLLDEIEAAEAQVGAAHTLFSQLGEQLGLMLLEHLGGQIARRRGLLSTAEAHYGRALHYFAGTNHRKMIARCLAGLSCVAVARADLPRAALVFGAAYRLFDQLPTYLPPEETAEYARLVGQARSSLDRPTFERRWREAQAMPLAQATAVALRIDT